MSVIADIFIARTRLHSKVCRLPHVKGNMIDRVGDDCLATMALKLLWIVSFCCHGYFIL